MAVHVLKPGEIIEMLGEQRAADIPKCPLCGAPMIRVWEGGQLQIGCAWACAKPRTSPE